MHRVTKRTWLIHVFLLILLLGMGFFLWEYMTEAQTLRIIRKHGADKILLASDCPWDNTADTIAKLRRIGLTEDEQRLIFAENAKKLLKVD